MLANFFGKSNPITLVVILAAFLGYFFGYVFLEYGFDNFLQIDYIFLLKSAVLYLSIFFFYNFILAKNKLTLPNSYGFLFFVILFGLFPEVLFDIDELLLQTVVFIFVRKILSFRNANSIIQKVFDSGFWLAIMFLINPLSALFVVLFVVVLAMFQSLKGQLLLVCLVGFITPLILYYTFWLWFDEPEKFYNLFFIYLDFDFSIFTTKPIGIPFGFILLFSVLSILIKTPTVISISGKFRKYWTLVIAYFLVSLAYVLLSDQKSGAELLSLFFPVAVILTNWLEGVKQNWLKEAILITFLLVPILLFII